jgi:hypothetical protein
MKTLAAEAGVLFPGSFWEENQALFVIVE